MRTPKRTAAIFLVSAVLAMVGVTTSFAPPAWWTQRQVIATGATPDNYAPANLGQAKWMATKALEEMNAKLAPIEGAGFTITDLFPAPPPGPGQAGYNATTWQAYVDSNYAPLNIGQLKNLSYRFYQRLKQIGYTAAPVNPSNPDGYPWTASTADDDNYAPANLGQLKNVFSFDLTLDSDNNGQGNGLPDWWENHFFGHTGVSSSGNDDGDGRTNLQEYQDGTNPIDSHSYSTGQPLIAGNAATFISQQVPSQMEAGKTYQASVTMHNVGTVAWTPGDQGTTHKLGSQNWQDNYTWGFSRVLASEAVKPWSQHTYTFTVTAPSTLGTYNIQWRMLQEAVQWFGDFTPNVTVQVVAPGTLSDFFNGHAPVLNASAISLTQVNLFWSLEGVNPGSLQGWSLERKAVGDPAGAYVEIAGIAGGTVHAFIDNAWTAQAGYTYRLRAFKPGAPGGSGSGYSLYSNEVSITAPQGTIAASLPSDDLLLWLKADAGVNVDPATGAVISWTDASGHGLNASAPSSANRPLRVNAALNGLPAVRFDGTSSSLSLPAGFDDFDAGLTALIVVKPTGAPAYYQRFFDFGNGAGSSNLILCRDATSSNLLYISMSASAQWLTSFSAPATIVQDSFQLLEATHGAAGAGAFLHKNGVLAAQGTSAAIPHVVRTSNFIGRSNWPGDPFPAEDIAEMLIFNRALNDAERKQWESYLNAKYQLVPLPSAPAQPSALPLSSSQMAVSWSASSQGVTGHRLERQNTDGSWSLIATLAENVTSYIDTGLNPGATYSYRVSATNLLGSSPASSVVSAATKSVGSGVFPLSGFQFWLRADAGVKTDASGAVSAWADQAGGGYSAGQSNASGKPLLIANDVNGRAAVRFDGDDWLESNFSGMGGQELTFFVVTKGTQYQSLLRFQPAGSGNYLIYPWNSNQVFINSADGGTGAGVNSGLVSGQWNVGVATYKAGDQMTTYRNGERVDGRAAANANLPGGLPLNLGRYMGGGEYLQADVAEVLVYNRALSKVERGQIEDYLNVKYNLGMAESGAVRPAAGQIPPPNSPPATSSPGNPGAVPNQTSVPNPGGGAPGPQRDVDPPAFYAPQLSVKKQYDSVLGKYVAKNAQLRWNSQPNVVTYKIERRKIDEPPSEKPWKILNDKVPGTQTSYLDKDLILNTRYQYRVTAVGQKGKSLASAPVPYMAPFEPRLYIKQSENQKEKEGWYELENRSFPPVKYLKRVITSTFDVTGAIEEAFKINQTEENFPKDNVVKCSKNFIFGSITVDPVLVVEDIGGNIDYSWYKQVASNRRLSENAIGGIESKFKFHAPGWYGDWKHIFDGSYRFSKTGTKSVNGDINYDYDGDSKLYGSYINSNNLPVSYPTNDIIRTNDAHSVPINLFDWEGTDIYTDSLWPEKNYNGALWEPAWISYTGDVDNIDYRIWSEIDFRGLLFFWFSEADASDLTEDHSQSHQIYKGQGSTDEIWLGGQLTWAMEQYSREWTGKREITLSNVYRTEDFIKDVASDMPDYPEKFTLYDLAGWTVANKDLDKYQVNYSVKKAIYKLKNESPAKVDCKILEIFVPSDDPDTLQNESQFARVMAVHEWKADETLEKPEEEIDPTKPGPNIDGRNGIYYIACLPNGLNVYDDSSLRGSDDPVIPLDSTEKASEKYGAEVVRGASPEATYFTLPKTSILPGTAYQLNWDAGNKFTVIDSVTNLPVKNHQIFDAQEAHGRKFYLVGAKEVKNGDKITISMKTFVDIEQIDENAFTAHYVVDPRIEEDRFTLSADDASGPRYRKIALNGRPMADEKPQHTAETDQEKEETYIDALTLGLHHSTTDVYIPIPGSDLTLSIRRNTQSEVWNTHSGLRPHERPDQPFGVGWNSNISPHVEFTKSAGQPGYAYVTDQNGAVHRFIQIEASNADIHYLPMPTARHELSEYLNSFDGYTFTSKYGTSIDFEYAVYMAVSANRAEGSVEQSYHTFYRASSIYDRLGNGINYSYSSETSLIPSAISSSQFPEQTIYIRQNEKGRVISIWDPEKHETKFEYSTIDYTDLGKSFKEDILTSVTTPDGAIIRYAYDYQIEADLTPLPEGDLPVPKYHCDISAITSPKGTHAFHYNFDNTRLNYSTVSGDYYPQTGNPRYIVQVNLPGIDAPAQFTNNDSSIWLYYNGEGLPMLGGSRNTSVIDTCGKSISYAFSDPRVFLLNEIDVYFPSSVSSFLSIPKMAYHTKMDLAFGDLGSESYTFDPDIGLALKSTTDFSGNVTTFQYGDALPWPNDSAYKRIFSPGGFNGHYEDPTAQTDARLQTKQFHYGVYRIMDQVIDQNGHRTKYELDGSGRRIKELIYSTSSQDQSERLVQETRFDYENGAFPGVVTRRTVLRHSGDPAWATDLVTAYELDDGGRVKHEIVDPEGLHLTTESTYDKNGNKLTVKDPRQNLTRFFYDERNRLRRVIHPDGSYKDMEYDECGNKVQEMDENGHLTKFKYDILNRLTEERRVRAAGDMVKSYTYNDVNSRASVSDGRSTTQMEYDDLQRLVRTTVVPLGYVTEYKYDGANSGGSAFNSSGFKPTSVIDPRPEHYRTINTYDKLYRLTEKKVEYQPNVFASTKYEYDKVGNPIMVTDARQHATWTDYDALNRPTLVTFADTKTSRNFYTSTGLKWKTQDELLKETETEYDAAGRPVLVRAPEALNENGVPQRPSTQTLYDESGNAVATINPLGRRWDYSFDSRNRKWKEQQPEVRDATTGAFARPTVYTGYDFVGNVTYFSDARGYTTESFYDEANLPVRSLAPPVPLYGSQTAHRPETLKEYDAQGNLTRLTDPEGHVTTNAYDALNRLSSTLDAAQLRVRYEYDAAGNRTLVQEGAQTPSLFEYDGLNRNTKITYASGSATSFVYDGLLKLSRTDPLGQATIYGYDLRDRIKSVSYPGRASEGRSYSYDEAGNLTGVSESANGGKGSVGYTFDALHRLTSETSGGFTHTYKYDAAGNRKAAIYGGTNRTLLSSYDALNRLESVQEQDRSTGYGYDLAGNAVRKELPNGEAVQSGFDGLGRLQWTLGSKGPGGEPLYQYLNGYDAAGNARWINEWYAAGASGAGSAAPWRNLELDYDGANRLVGETLSDDQGTRATSYEFYEGTSNRKQRLKAGRLTHYDFNALNQLTGFSESGGAGASRSVSFTYDLNGNRNTRNENGRTDLYGYDAENRLTSLGRGGVGGINYAYAYDYRSRRVERAEGQAVTAVSFSGGTSVQERTGSSLAAEFIRGSDFGGGVGGVLYSLRGGVARFNHYDRRGDVTRQSDAAGGTSWQAAYGSFGEREKEAGENLDRQRANTKEEDPTGLLNEGMRYRDLEAGVFLTRDPLGFVDGPNLYAYVRQNPWSSFDPQGLAEELTYGKAWSNLAFQDGGANDFDTQKAAQATDVLGPGTAVIGAAATAVMTIAPGPKAGAGAGAAEEVAPSIIRSAGDSPNFVQKGWNGAIGLLRQGMRAITGEAEVAQTINAESKAVAVGELGASAAQTVAKNEMVAAESASSYVYRAIRADELATIQGGQGILRGSGGTTATQHVLGAKHANNPWVSTTNSLKSAQFFATHGGTQPAGTIIRIDLNKVANPIFDVSNPAAASSLLKHPRAVNFSSAHGEVLIKGGVNPEAISILSP